MQVLVQYRMVTGQSHERLLARKQSFLYYNLRMLYYLAVLL